MFWERISLFLCVSSFHELKRASRDFSFIHFFDDTFFDFYFPLFTFLFIIEDILAGPFHEEKRNQYHIHQLAVSFLFTALVSTARVAYHILIVI